MAALRAMSGCRGRGPPIPPLGPIRGVGGWGVGEGPLGRWLRDLETWGEGRRRRRIQRLNRPRSPVSAALGAEAAAAAFALSLGGSVRLQGQQLWLRPTSPWPRELQRLRHLPVEALDLSSTPLTYDGFDNLLPLSQLRALDLSGCALLDDWALSRLRGWAGSLEELALVGCPLLTHRGLGTLHHLRRLRRLSVGGLRVPNPPLLKLLLEEALPGCRVIGLDTGDTPV